MCVKLITYFALTTTSPYRGIIIARHLNSGLHYCNYFQFISSSDPKTRKVNLKDGTRAGVRVRLFTLSHLNISETSGPIAIKFYLKHHWDREKAALGFGTDRIRILVFMATDSSHRVIMEKILLAL